jgi:hypothetical protein
MGQANWNVWMFQNSFLRNTHIHLLSFNTLYATFVKNSINNSRRPSCSLSNLFCRKGKRFCFIPLQSMLPIHSKFQYIPVTSSGSNALESYYHTGTKRCGRGSWFEEHIQKQKTKSTIYPINREKLNPWFHSSKGSCLVRHAHTTRNYQVFSFLYANWLITRTTKLFGEGSSTRFWCFYVWSTFRRKQMSIRNTVLNWTWPQMTLTSL